MSASVLANVTRAINGFWFGDPWDADYGRFREQWFKKDPAFDKKITRQFAKLVESAGEGYFDMLAESPEGAVALILVLDQFPRNIYRGTAKAFAHDPKALGVAKAAVAKGFDEQLIGVMRMFLYLPYEHSENLDDQNTAVALFERAGLEEGLKWAIAHRDVIERFGRFPHRNAILGRENTPEEAAYLEDPDAGF